MRKLLGEALSDNLEPLPDNPDLIPEQIIELLPFDLPISEYRHTRAVVAAPRKIYSFSQLPSFYFSNNKLPLLYEIADLHEAVRDLFSISKFKTLVRLSEYRATLKEYYYFDCIPSQYFDLPAPEYKKDPLPLTPQELLPNLCRMFPIDPMSSPQDFKSIMDLLWEKYEFKKLPNDYIIAKLALPTDPLKIKTDLVYVKSSAGTNSESHSPNIMQVNLTDKPELPTKVEGIKEYHITTPITISSQLVDMARLLREIYYFDRLPKEWIDIAPNDLPQKNPKKPNLSSNLEELSLYINEKIFTLTTQVPITDYNTTTNVINQNSRTLQDLLYTKLPNQSSQSSPTGMGNL
ncbi:23731_t:CDS:2 [Gigaspora rosea]|nr:23731_t:CDS:2 [Gigaspora rosea]